MSRTRFHVPAGFLARAFIGAIAAIQIACAAQPPIVASPNPRFLGDEGKAIPIRLDLRDPDYSGGGQPVIGLNAERGTYVVVAKVTSRYQVEILYPKSPASQKPYSGIPEEREIRFIPGSYEAGAVYALASDKPFDFSKVVKGNSWPKRITKYEGVGQAAITPTTASRLDIAAALFFGDITPSDATIGLDGRLYSGRGPLEANRVSCRAAETRTPCR